MSWLALNTESAPYRFLYSVTLRQSNLPEPIQHARELRKLPVVLAADEVVHFLKAMPSLECLAALTIAYSMLSARVQVIITAFADSRGCVSPTVHMSSSAAGAVRTVVRRSKTRPMSKPWQMQSSDPTGGRRRSDVWRLHSERPMKSLRTSIFSSRHSIGLIRFSFVRCICGNSI